MKAQETRTPSMDDKATPSPPVRTTDQYEADKAAGIQRIARREEAEERR